MHLKGKIYVYMFTCLIAHNQDYSCVYLHKIHKIKTTRSNVQRQFHQRQGQQCALTLLRIRVMFIPPRQSSLGGQRLYGYVTSYATVKGTSKTSRKVPYIFARF